MVPAPLLNETALDLQISFDIEGDTKPSEAIVDAFLALNVAIYEEPTALEDWIDTDVLDTLVRSSNDGPLYVSALVWGYRVVLTAGSVRIYAGTITPSDNPFRIEDTLY